MPLHPSHMTNSDTVNMTPQSDAVKLKSMLIPSVPASAQVHKVSYTSQPALGARGGSGQLCPGNLT